MQIIISFLLYLSNKSTAMKDISTKDRVYMAMIVAVSLFYYLHGSVSITLLR